MLLGLLLALNVGKLFRKNSYYKINSSMSSYASGDINSRRRNSDVREIAKSTCITLNLSRLFTPLSLAANIQAILDTSGLDNAIENPVLKL